MSSAITIATEIFISNHFHMIKVYALVGPAVKAMAGTGAGAADFLQDKNLKAAASGGEGNHQIL